MKPKIVQALALSTILCLLTSCGVARWAFEGTTTQPSPAQQIGDAAQSVLPAPFGALIAGAIGLGALAYAATKKKDQPPPSA